MLEKLKDKKTLVKIGCILGAIVIAIVLFFVLKPSIKFNEDYKVIEYGTEYKYEDMIEKVSPKDAEIIYPEFKATEVGNYDLTFQIKKGNKTYPKNFKFTIQDTVKPKLSLFYINDSIQVRLNRKNYDVLENVYAYKYVDESAIKNINKLPYEEYTAFIEQLNKTSAEIAKRNITSLEDIKEYDLPKNGIFYSEEIDLKTEGVYPVYLCLVDENYNYVVTSWNVEVINSERILTSGGVVTCTYKGDELEKGEEYSIKSVEKYTYNPFKLITGYELITTMSFSDDYDTKDNINLMMSTLKKKYSKYDKIEGVTVKITNSKNVVKTSIKVDLTKYDKTKDELNILRFDIVSEIDVEEIMDEAGKNGYVCTFK